MYIVGIDPGPVTGIVRLFVAGRPDETVKLIRADALQVTLGALIDVLAGLAYGPATIAYERFVVGSRAGRSAAAGAGERTRSAIGAIEEWANQQGHQTNARSAANVKPWATDTRLAAAGLLEDTKGMRHARDAARHALFCAVRDYGLPDPLSCKAGVG
jgi:hypothetical protein